MSISISRRKLMTAAAACLAASVVGTQAANAQSVTLRMATWLPAAHHLTGDTLLRWFKAVDEASGGTLKIVLDPAPIAKPPQQYDIVRKGAADMAYHVMAYTPGPFEIVRAAELPFLSPSAEIGSQATWDWYERNIGFENEFKDVKVVTIWVHGPGLLHTKKEIKTLEDLAGVKLRVGGGGVRLSEALGATPVAMPAPQAYESIRKGVTEGAMFPWEAIKGFKLSEVVDKHLEVPGGLYATPFALVMNKEKWESLSDAHKQVLRDVGGLRGAQIIGEGWDDADVAGKKVATDGGATIQTISDAELARWREKLAPMYDTWIEKANAAGHDGAALIEDLRATMATFAGG